MTQLIIFIFCFLFKWTLTLFDVNYYILFVLKKAIVLKVVLDKWPRLGDFVGFLFR